MGKCAVCGRKGITISVEGKPFSICLSCLDPLISSLTDLRAALASAGALRVRRRPAEIKPVTREEFKQKLIERVEARGRISVYEFARRHGLGRPAAREVAKEVADEKGYEIISDMKRLVLAKKTA